MANKPKKGSGRRGRHGVRLLPARLHRKFRSIVNGKLVPQTKFKRFGEIPFMDLPERVGSKGTISFRIIDSKRGRRAMVLTGAYTPPHERSKGYGRLLLRDAIRRAEKARMRAVWVDTGSERQFGPARRLLKSEGFKTTGSEWAKVNGQRLYRVISFEKRLR